MTGKGASLAVDKNVREGRDTLNKEALPRPLAILQELGNQPATSYFEANVARVVERILDGAGIVHETDEYGNIIARVTRPSPPGGAAPRPIALVAHMDHPGFEVIAVDGARLTTRMLGGLPRTVYDQAVGVIVHSSNGGVLHGSTTGRDSNPDDRTVMVGIDELVDVSLPAYVVFDLPGFELRGDEIHMRACDDLAGCASTLAALEITARGDEPVDAYGVFTRAEEDGLIGARLLAASARLPAETVVVSVESSRTLPGAEQGNGPVIRVGDAASTFSQSAEEHLQTARQQLLRRDPPIAVQRQLMSGGVCEATAFIANGYASTGVAFPLGHYHNGLGEDAISAETIRVGDFLGGVELLLEAVHAASAAGPESAAALPPIHQRLRSAPDAEGQRLRESLRAG